MIEFRSRLCVGSVVHVRRADPPHRIERTTDLLLLDEAELDQIDRRLRLFGHERARPVSFRAKDHFFPPHRPVREALGSILRERGYEPPDGRLLMLTHARSLGHVFNPVSFYWWYDASERLAFRVAEVDNTYGERHVYLLPADAGETPSLPKRMHVSPFFEVRGSYRFHLPDPLSGSKVRVGVDLLMDGETCLQARVVMDRRPLSDGTLLRALARRPMVSALDLAAIHWEAFRLWRKGATFRDPPPYGQDYESRVSS